MTLSDKRQELQSLLINSEIDIKTIFSMIKKQDKEFIKELKENIIHYSGQGELGAKERMTLVENIDKGAGPDLT